MKKHIFILMAFAFLKGYCQEKFSTSEQIKKYNYLADSLYGLKQYSAASSKYFDAYSFSQRKDKHSEQMRDSCNYYLQQKKNTENKNKEQAFILDWINKKGWTISFDNNDKPISYKTVTGEIKIIDYSVYATETNRELQKIDKEYYKTHKIN